MLTKARLAAIRAMHDEAIRAMRGDELDGKELVAANVLMGALVGFVPDLLDEIERLRAGTPERAVMLKMDSQSGVA